MVATVYFIIQFIVSLFFSFSLDSNQRIVINKKHLLYYIIIINYILALYNYY